MSDTPTPVNQDEMARILGVSLPTMRSYITRHEDFPFIERGKNGKAWQFHAPTVIAFLEAKRREAAEAAAAGAAARDAELAQFRLPMDDAPDAPTAGLSPQDRLAATREMKLRQEMAIQSAQLIPVTEARRAAREDKAAMARFLQDLPDQLGRALGLPAHVTAELRRRMDEARETYGRAMMDVLGPIEDDAPAPA